MKEILLYITCVVCFSTSFVYGADMKDDEIISFLKNELADLEYVNVVRSSSDGRLEKVESDFVRKNYIVFKFYKMDQTYPGHQFLFAINKDKNEVLLLSGRPENVNKILTNIQESNIRTVNEYVTEFVRFSNEFHHLTVEIISDEKAKEWLGSDYLTEYNFKPLEMRKVSKNLYEGEYYIVKGEDLVLRKLELNDGMVSLVDDVIHSDASRFLQNH